MSESVFLQPPSVTAHGNPPEVEALVKDLSAKLMRVIASEPEIEGRLHIAASALIDASMTVAAMKAKDAPTVLALLRCIAEARVGEHVLEAL